MASLYTVNQYLSFVTGPLSPNSPLALALHQWAFMLLCLRFEQLGKEITGFLKERLKDEANLLGAEIAANSKAHLNAHKTVQLLETTLAQTERLKEECQLIGNLPLPRFVPLPPFYDGGRDGALFFKRSGEKKKRVWQLKFAFDLENVGPLEIRAQAVFPEIKLAFASPSPKTLALTRTMLPLLKEKLQEIGVTTSSSVLREAEVSFKEDFKEDDKIFKEGLYV